jgi:hypothetical protein
MNTPLRLDNESEKAYAAFDAYVQMGTERSIRKCARQVHKATTVLARYSKKNRWLERIAAQQRREAEQKIAAEARAAEVTATITETEKASAWRKAFDLADKFISHAAKIHDRDESGAASLARAALAVLESMSGGVARGFHVGVAVNTVAQQFPEIAFDENGKPVSADAHFLQSYEAACKLLERGEELPCDNWDKNSIHATPTFEPEGDRTHAHAREEPSGVPSRAGEGEIPCHDPQAQRSLGNLDVKPEDEEATLPSYKMFDDVSCVVRSRTIAGDP